MEAVFMEDLKAFEISNTDTSVHHEESDVLLDDVLIDESINVTDDELLNIADSLSSTNAIASTSSTPALSSSTSVSALASPSSTPALDTSVSFTSNSTFSTPITTPSATSVADTTSAAPVTTPTPYQPTTPSLATTPSVASTPSVDTSSALTTAAVTPPLATSTPVSAPIVTGPLTRAKIAEKASATAAATTSDATTINPARRILKIPPTKRVAKPKTTLAPVQSTTPQQSTQATPQQSTQATPSPQSTPQAASSAAPTPSRRINLAGIKKTAQKEPAASKTEPIILPPSVRPDGTVRKERKVRPGYVPPDEKQPSPIPKVTVTPAVTVPSPITNGTADLMEDDAEIDILSDEEAPSSPSAADSLTSPAARSSTPKEAQRARPNNTYLSKLLSSTQFYNTKILPGLLEEKDLLDEDRDGSKSTTSELGEIEEIFKKSTQAILKEIDKIRRVEGTLLLQQIAKRYGLRIQVLDDGVPSSSGGTKRNAESEEETEPKRSRLSPALQDAVRKGRQVRIRKTVGAIGYRQGADPDF